MLGKLNTSTSVWYNMNIANVL
uniref:Uncharacterized protein n=1 Tax=Anguilla anguilla TaxID=7936 RepID=A0A0E9RWL8_ANGAN